MMSDLDEVEALSLKNFSKQIGGTMGLLDPTSQCYFEDLYTAGEGAYSIRDGRMVGLGSHFNQNRNMNGLGFIPSDVWSFTQLEISCDN